MQSAVLSQPRSRRNVQRVAAAALMATLFVGATAGAALADTSSRPAVRTSLIVSTPTTSSLASGLAEPIASPTAVPTFSIFSSSSTSNAGSMTALKSTPVRWFEPNQTPMTGTDTAGRITLIWAVAAAVVMAGVLAGTVLNRR
jgi:hypothetical protein